MTKHTRIYTGGRKVDGAKFMGEVMTCAICGKQLQSDPKVESGWTYVDLGDGKGGYICPDELPGPDALRQQYQLAWERILRKLIRL